MKLTHGHMHVRSIENVSHPDKTQPDGTSGLLEVALLAEAQPSCKVVHTLWAMPARF